MDTTEEIVVVDGRKMVFEVWRFRGRRCRAFLRMED